MFSRVRFDVHVPPPGHFNSYALHWNNNDAFIPSSRVDDFIKGEESRRDSICLFRKKTTEDPNMTRGHKIIRYWCSYGPKDFRGRASSAAQPDSTYKPPPKGKGSRPAAQRISMGMSCQRGCQCHFAIVTFRDKPGFSLIRWANREHVDKDGKPCHGLLDPTAREVNAHMAHKLSKSCLDFVRNLLQNGVKPSQIILQHRKYLEEIAKANGESLDPVLSRDLQLRVRDVLNVQAMMKNKEQAMADNDPDSVSVDTHEDADSKGAEQGLIKQPRKRPFSQLDPNLKSTTSKSKFVSIDPHNNRDKPKDAFMSVGINCNRGNVSPSSGHCMAAVGMERAPPMEVVLQRDRVAGMQAAHQMDRMHGMRAPLQMDRFLEMQATLQMQRVSELQGYLQMDRVPEMQAPLQMGGLPSLQGFLQIETEPTMQAPPQMSSMVHAPEGYHIELMQSNADNPLR